MNDCPNRKPATIPWLRLVLRERADAHHWTRERLAAWVTHPGNRHFARATVNRVWAMMLGRPLLKRVESPSARMRIHN